MNTEKQDLRVAQILTLAVFVIYLVHAFLLDGSYGGGDGIRHYLVSRWSWQHPEQFLYHWGKPFFTLVTSPFSQFGLIGIKIFNASIAAFTALLCYLIARKMDFVNAAAAVVFASFAPVYILCVNSGLTEPMFAFMLMLCIWLYLENKYILATILLSFLPFVRSEGNMMFPLFALVLIFRGKWVMIPLMAFGTVAYSIVGYFHYKDIFWIKTKNPYTGINYDIYGQGELMHFVNAHKLILGIPLSILFVLGLIYLIIRISKNPKGLFTRQNLHFEETVLIYGSFLIYFIAHSIFWWKGLFGSLGLERAIAGVIPAATLISLRGLQLGTSFIASKKSLRFAIYILFCIWIAAYPVYKKYVPLELDREEELVKEAGLWYNQSEYKNEKVYYLYPYFMHILNLDAFDGNRVGELWGLYPAIREWGIDVVPLNTVIMWDAHFGANEARIPLDSIMADPNFKLIKSFKPQETFTTLGGYNFEIHAFIRVKARNLVSMGELFFDLENPAGLGNTQTITEEKANSGVKSSHMKPGDEFGILYEKQLSEINEFEQLSTITYSFKIQSASELRDVMAVMSIDDESGSLEWIGKPVELTEFNNWKEQTFTFTVNPASLKPNARIKIYIWNKGGADLFVDDIKLKFQKYN